MKMVRGSLVLFTGEIDLICFVQIEMNGLTGKIKFDQRGQRSDFELDIIELKRDGLTRVKSTIQFYGCIHFLDRGS